MSLLFRIITIKTLSPWNLGSVPEEQKADSSAPTPETKPTTTAVEESKPTNKKEEQSEQTNVQQAQNGNSKLKLIKLSSACKSVK